jgi:hypothetical protein
MGTTMTSQRGLTVTGLLLAGIVVALVATIGMKVIPDVIEYTKIVSDIKAVAQDPNLRQASASDVRKAFERRAEIDQISAITPLDLTIAREGNTLVLSFAYEKRITLFGPVSLLIDFEGSSEK